MNLTAITKRKRTGTDAASFFVINKVKEIVTRYDKNADLILFGRRARGDWHDESD